MDAAEPEPEVVPETAEAAAETAPEPGAPAEPEPEVVPEAAEAAAEEDAAAPGTPGEEDLDELPPLGRGVPCDARSPATAGSSPVTNSWIVCFCYHLLPCRI